MMRLAPCTKETVALAKSLTDSEIEKLVEQIYREERSKDDYWDLMYAKDLLAVGIEPRIAPPRKIVARFDADHESIRHNWESRKSGEYVPYFGNAAMIAEYKAANQNTKDEA